MDGTAVTAAEAQRIIAERYTVPAEVRRHNRPIFPLGGVHIVSR